MKYQVITNIDQMKELLAASGNLMIFKHSTRCPVSAYALREYDNFIASKPNCHCAYVDVIKNREISNEISNFSGVTHQSPQALLFKDGFPSWSASHGDITEASLAASLEPGLNP